MEGTAEAPDAVLSTAGPSGHGSYLGEESSQATELRHATIHTEVSDKFVSDKGFSQHGPNEHRDEAFIVTLEDVPGSVASPSATATRPVSPLGDGLSTTSSELSYVSARAESYENYTI